MSHQSLPTLEYICNKELVKVDCWFRANELTANIIKASKYMLTYGKRKQIVTNI